MPRKGSARRRTKPQAESLTITRTDQVRLLTDPLRLKLLEAFAMGPRTTKQVAESLGEKPTRLYHHVDALERVGLIQLVKTRQNRGAVEKHYGAVAKRFVVESALFSAGKPASESPGVAMARSVMDTTFRELSEALEHPEMCSKAAPAIMARVAVVAGADEIRGLHEEILELTRRVEELCARKKGDRGEGRETYVLSVIFHPAAKRLR